MTEPNITGEDWEISVRLQIEPGSVPDMPALNGVYFRPDVLSIEFSREDTAYWSAEVSGRRFKVGGGTYPIGLESSVKFRSDEDYEPGEVPPWLEELVRKYVAQAPR